MRICRLAKHNTSPADIALVVVLVVVVVLLPSFVVGCCGSSSVPKRKVGRREKVVMSHQGFVVLHGKEGVQTKAKPDSTCIIFLFVFFLQPRTTVCPAARGWVFGLVGGSCWQLIVVGRPCAGPDFTLPKATRAELVLDKRLGCLHHRSAPPNPFVFRDWGVVRVVCGLCGLCVLPFIVPFVFRCLLLVHANEPTTTTTKQTAPPTHKHTQTQPPTHTHTHTHWFWLGHPHSAWSKREGQVGVLVVSVDQNFHFARQTYRKCTNGSRGDCFSLSSCRVCGFPRVAAAGGLTAAVLFLCLFLPLACLTIYQHPHIPPNTLVCLHFSSCLFFSKQLFWCWFFFSLFVFLFVFGKQTDKTVVVTVCSFLFLSCLFKEGEQKKKKANEHSNQTKTR